MSWLSSVKSASVVEALRFVSIKSQVLVVTVAEMLNLSTVLKNKINSQLSEIITLWSLWKMKRRTVKPEILKRKISGEEALLFHFSRIRVKLISKRSFLLPSVDVVRVSFLLPFVFLSSRVNLLQFGFLGNCQYIPPLLG